MFVYLDESGDAGFKFRQGSSRFFVVALLLVEDPIPLQTAIDELRSELSWAPDNEFKFSSSSTSVKRAFFRMLLRQNVVIRALVVDKTRIRRTDLLQREAFYLAMIRSVLTAHDGSIQNALLILDESVKNRQTKNEMTTYLRRALNTDPEYPTVRAIRYHNSRSDNLIQVADMVSGAIYAAYHRRDDTYIRLIRSKIHDLRELEDDVAEQQ